MHAAAMTQAASTAALWLPTLLSFLSAVALPSQGSQTLITVERQVDPHSGSATASSPPGEYSLCECFRDNSICSSSHTIIRFNSGVYDVSTCMTNATSVQFLVRDIENFTLTAPYQVGQPETTLYCSTRALFVFINVTNLNISGITFLKCGAQLTPVIFEALNTYTNTFITVRENFMATLFMLNIMMLSIDSISVSEGEGFGLLAVNALGVSEVVNSVFSWNNYERFMKAYSKEGWCSCNSVEGGNTVFAFVDSAFAQEISPILRVLNTNFTKGATSSLRFYQRELSNSVQGHNITFGAGLSTILAQTNYVVSLGMSKVKSSENTALEGANMMMVVYDMSLQGDNTFQIENSELSYGNTGVDYTEAEGGGMMYICGVSTPHNFKKQYSSPRNRQEQTDNTLLILHEIHFHNNKAAIGGGLSIQEINKGQDDMQGNHTVIIFNCRFVDNTALSGSAMYIFQSQNKKENGLYYPFLTEVHFTLFQGNGMDSSHMYGEYLSLQRQAGSVVSFDQVQIVVLSNCTLQNNTLVGILAVSSFMYFHGENTFRNNKGTYGGAIAMYLGSIMYLENNTRLNITENHAYQFGGGIYISGLALAFIVPPCPYQLHVGTAQRANTAVRLKDIHTRVYMRKNTAGITGDTIFGGDLGNCSQLYVESNPEETFKQTFKIDINLTNPKQTGVSSEPMGPCFCENNIPNCAQITMNKSVFSGEKFSVSLVGVGQFNGLVPSVIVIDLYINNQTQASIYPKKLQNQCDEVEYSISTINNATLILHTDPLLGKYISREIQLIITECPRELGYSAKNDSCVCDDKLRGSCVEQTGNVSRMGTVWIGFSKGCILYHPYCPYDYCKDDKVVFKLSDESDKQCRYSRTGLLCGGCPKGLSLTLGISKCMQCHSSDLWMLVVFALAGLGLVMLLFVANLTVSAGTINGLIIYTNIIQINHFIFFPDGKPRSVAIPLAWLNLDLGIRQCLYNGLNGYAKTWLQFIFPAYIWGIAFLIIFATRYSRFMQRLCGPNAVQVLATLFLLSYGKLQRTVIVSLSCTLLKYDNKSSIVWMYDANITCFTGRHLILALFSILILLCFIIPMMLLLLLAPQLQAWSHKPIFKWMNTLKPLIDAYQGPYKGKHRHWLGSLLLAQNFLMLVFACNFAASPEINCLAIITAMAILTPIVWRSDGVYRHWPKTALECFLFVNLEILAALALYFIIRDRTKTQKDVSALLVGMAIAVFVFLVVFHTIQNARKIQKFDRLVLRFLGLPCIKQTHKFITTSTDADSSVTNALSDTELLHPRDPNSYDLVISRGTRSDLNSSTSLSGLSLSGCLDEPLMENYTNSMDSL